MMGSVHHFRVWRGDQAGGQLEDFQVEVNEGEVVLDIIHRLQATQAPDLAVRWNCKAGKCGSCSMEINGQPRLGCMTRMSIFEEGETVTVTPLRTFPVIRDLVTDVSFNYEKAREMPAFAPPADLKPGEYRMQQVDVERSQEFRKCIECFLCQNTCHVVRDHEENKAAFAGPRYLMRQAELDMHPLDSRPDRRREAQEDHGLGYCNITKCCTEVCPEHIKITDNAIIPLKERVADEFYDPIQWAWRKLRGRSDSAPDRRTLPVLQAGRQAEPSIEPTPERLARAVGEDSPVAEPMHAAAPTSSTPAAEPTPAAERTDAGKVAKARLNSSRRLSRRCSTAAVTSSALVGKWCSCAPRERPARSAIFSNRRCRRLALVRA